MEKEFFSGLKRFSIFYEFVKNYSFEKVWKN